MIVRKVATGSSRWRRSQWRPLAAGLCALLFWVAPTDAVLIEDGDGSGNTSNPSFFGWQYVGEVNGLSGTYLGDGWVITANHVGPGDFTLDGTPYPWIQGSEVRLRTNGSTLSDLVMFAVWPHPPLAPLTIRTSPPPIGELLVMIGCGRDRGADTTWASLSGWDWAPTSSKRWGTNFVEELTTGLILGTVSFYTSFDPHPVFPEAQATAGDSGGAVFTLGATSTELAGIIYAVGPTPGQPPNTALFTNLTFIARLDFYLDEINDVIAMPEPTRALPWGIGLLALLARRRRRSRAVTGPRRSPCC